TKTLPRLKAKRRWDIWLSTVLIFTVLRLREERTMAARCLRFSRVHFINCWIFLKELIPAALFQAVRMRLSGDWHRVPPGLRRNQRRRDVGTWHRVVLSRACLRSARAGFMPYEFDGLFILQVSRLPV